MSEKRIVALTHLEQLARRTKQEADALKERIDQLQITGGSVSKVSQLENDLKFQTAEQVSAAIAEQATKVEAGDENGTIKVDGQQTTVYTLPDTVLHESDIAGDEDVSAMLSEVFDKG